ncbi:MAG: hypothetical protein WD071_01540 [Pseudohongiella sp.]|uniref:CAF17-like 4Fe-4S cluster assembly/insertion protein YgfZ n=1 Tax=Pseudohongiella sp. TaxID=1979412 RepID=UPI0034A08A7E
MPVKPSDNSNADKELKRPIADEANRAWLTQLDDFDIIAVSGPDSERFLQGQLSCNMDRLSPTRTLRAALCNLKGRVVADLRVVMHDDRLLLLCSAGMADIVLGTLQKYQVFFKTELQKVSEQFVVLGLVGNEAAKALSAAGIHAPETRDACTVARGAAVIRIEESPARFYCVLSASHGELASTLSSGCQSGSEQDWRIADIRAGIAHIRPGQQDLYTPQLLNYDIDGTIDFKKGCYTGQEVVARMYYRAEAKKRLAYLALSNSQQLPEGREIVDSVQHPDGQMHVLAIMPVPRD